MSEVAVREPLSLYSCPAAAQMIRSQITVSRGLTMAAVLLHGDPQSPEGPSFTPQGSWLSLY